MRPMLRLANQSPFVAVSELARRRLPDCSFATRMTPVCNSAKIRILHFEIRNPEMITQDFGEPKFTD